MIHKAAMTGLTHALALNRFNEARLKSGAVVEMLEQSDGLWTVTVVWDDNGAPVDFKDLAAFDEISGAPSPPAAADSDELGSLSRRFESNGNPGAIGFDKTGGFSYGAYQIATQTGTMMAFLEFLAQRFPASGAKLVASGGNEAAKAGTDGFKSAWRELGKRFDFAEAQHAFIRATHYDPFVGRLAQGPLFLDVDARSAVLRDVAWSVAVQHGPSNKIFDNALVSNTVTLNDRGIIQRVYAERSKISKYFATSTPTVQAAVLNRFKEELRVALSQLP